jgi:hypothetical protein
VDQIVTEAFAAIREECAKVAEQYCNDRAAHPGGCEIAHAIRTARPAKAGNTGQDNYGEHLDPLGRFRK